MSMHDLIEYISNYSDTAGRLQLCCKDESTNFDNVIANDDDSNLLSIT